MMPEWFGFTVGDLSTIGALAVAVKFLVMRMIRIEKQLDDLNNQFIAHLRGGK